MKLNVPYYSQFIDVTDPFWMIRSCGAISLKIVLEYHGKFIPDIIQFCDEAKDKGGYDIKNGWVHNYLVIKAQEAGLNAYRKEDLVNLDEIISSITLGNPVIVSVEKRILEQRRFHMIVIVGYDDENIIYHETESTDKDRGQYHVCTKKVFLEFWRGKAIFISKA